MKKKLAGVALVLAAVSLMSIQPVEACTRAVYIGPDQMVVTGRTMDWKEDIMTNIYVVQPLSHAGIPHGESIRSERRGAVLLKRKL